MLTVPARFRGRGNSPISFHRTALAFSVPGSRARSLSSFMPPTPATAAPPSVTVLCEEEEAAAAASEEDASTAAEAAAATSPPPAAAAGEAEDALAVVTLILCAN